MILPPAGPGRLVRNDGAQLWTAPALAVFTEPGPARVDTHTHPAWKVVLCLEGHAEVHVDGRLRARSAGVVVPPQLSHTCSTSGPYVAVFVDSWRVAGRAAGVRELDTRATTRILRHLPAGRSPDPAEVRAALDPVLGPAPALDPRLHHALELLPRADSVDGLAARAGVSPSHLRTLTREAIGIPLVRLRQWVRVRSAISALGHTGPAEAAHHAGLTDQSHLTRLSRTLLGRTPGSIRAAVSSPPSRH